MVPPHTMAVKGVALGPVEREGGVDLMLSMRCAICSTLREVTHVSSEGPVGQQASCCDRTLVEGGCNAKGCWAIKVTARVVCGGARSGGTAAELRSLLSAA